MKLFSLKPQNCVILILVVSVLIGLISLLSLSIQRSLVIQHEWKKLSANYRKARQNGDNTSKISQLSRLGNYDLVALRIIDRSPSMLAPATLDDLNIVGQLIYNFNPNNTPQRHVFMSQNTGISQIIPTMAMIVTSHDKPIELIGIIDSQIVGFTIDQQTIYHQTLGHASFLIIIVLGISIPTCLIVLWLHLRFQRRPLRDLLKILRLISDDPTIIQPIPKSLQSFGDLQTVAQAIEDLQRNMARELTQRERLADIGEAVAKINHDIRNVLSSATLVSDALLSSKDENVRKSAPLVLRSLEQAVDLCQSMLDYLAQTPDPIPSDFELPELLAEIQSASLLKLRYQGPRIMHADRNMMSRILLNLARNAGTAGANMMWVEVWQVGHLAIMDISDNGAGIPRSAWPNLFSPFKSTQGSGGGLGLAISRDLTLAQGGMLRLSRSSSDGSEFRIQFAVRVFPTLSNTVEMMWHDVASPQSP